MDQYKQQLHLTPIQIKAAGLCVGIFLCVIYLGFSVFYNVRWYIQTTDWTEVRGVYQKSEVVLGYKMNRFVPLHYTYQNQEYTERVRLSQEQLRTPMSQIGQPTGSILLKIHPNRPNEILVDPRGQSWEYGKYGLFFLIASILWYLYFNRAKKVVEKF